MLQTVSHILTTLSFPPDATFEPSGAQSSAKTSSACPGSSCFNFLSFTLQTDMIREECPKCNY